MKAGLQVDEGVAGRAVQNSRGGREEEGHKWETGCVQVGWVIRQVGNRMCSSWVGD